MSAFGKVVDDRDVAKVVGTRPMIGAGWDQLMGAASHLGFRATCVTPSNLKQVREWTDQGIPVVIGWTSSDHGWAHASVIFDVKDEQVFVADPNISNPEKFVRIFSHDDFYDKWYEKSPKGYLIRRPACAIEPEITVDGRPRFASNQDLIRRVASQYLK